MTGCGVVACGDAFTRDAIEVWRDLRVLARLHETRFSDQILGAPKIITMCKGRIARRR
jgi:hypothetical protein